MNAQYQARWVSKPTADTLRRQGKAMLLDSFKGIIAVEPMGTNRENGEVLSREESDFELRSTWCPAAKNKIRQARQMLGLSPDSI